VWKKKRAAAIADIEQTVLLALLRSCDAYGISIRDSVEERTGRRIALSSIYAALERLEDRGFVRAWMGDPTAQRGGRRKKLYALQPRGRAAVSSAYQDFKALTDGLEGLLERP
jgi:PadR family transcriptional regulator PadR